MCLVIQIILTAFDAFKTLPEVGKKMKNYVFVLYRETGGY